MPTELYYAPKDDNTPLFTLAQIRERFAAAGLPCTIEADDTATDSWWLIFETLSNITIYASTKSEKFVFATVEFPFDDDPAFIEKIDQVFKSVDFYCDDSDGYA